MTRSGSTTADQNRELAQDLKLEKINQERKEPMAEASEEILLPAEVAARLRVTRSWVYRHADDLGAYHVGKYLRFQWTRVLERLDNLPREVGS